CFTSAADGRRGYAKSRALLLLLRRPRRQGLWHSAEPGQAKETRPPTGRSHVQTVFQDGKTGSGRTRQVRHCRTDLQGSRRQRPEEVVTVADSGCKRDFCSSAMRPGAGLSQRLFEMRPVKPERTT